MLDEINVLREKLEMQVLENKAYGEILETSRQIDRLLVEYYKSVQPATLMA